MISKKKLRAAAAFLALVLVALAIVPAGPALAVSQSEIDALEEQRDALKAEREEMQAGIDELKNEQAGVLEQKRALDEQDVYKRQIMNKYGMDIDAMLNVRNKKSGVLGVSGVSSDFRDLETAADEGNERARLALDMFDYWVAKVVGSYVAAMNGVDAIIFTAGVGENSATTRAGICKYLGYLCLLYTSSGRR